VQVAAVVLGVGAFAILAQAPLPAAPSAVVTEKPTQLQRIARSLVAAGAPGAIVYLRTPKGVRSAAAGLAQLQPRAPMRVADHYRIGSITKTYVATVVLQLVADGSLNLDDSVERWLPGLVPNGSAITVRMLLNHTSGLYNYADDPKFVALAMANPSREWAPRELVAFAVSHPPLFPPGSAAAYCNTGYILLGLLVESVTAESLGEVLRERLFEPLRLRETSFGSGIAIANPVAHGYWAPQGTLVDLTPILNASFGWAAGQMVSTVGDVSKFFSALLGGRVLPASLLKQMKAVPPPQNGWVAGLGLLTTRTRCGTAFGHGGDAVGWHSEALATADGRRVAVIMVNYAPERLEGRFAAAPTVLCSR
jgi:D-alanyl-D-alanine carboxypeptidase